MQMTHSPLDTYLDLMTTVRARLDMIATLSASVGNNFDRAETAAFHGRKIIEGIAFACLVATDNGLKQVPRDAKGQWSAEKILKGLQRTGLHTFPSPSEIRVATEQEQLDSGAKTIIEGIPERRITPDALIEIYQHLHNWLHEFNPYVRGTQTDFYATHGQHLWSELQRVDRFIERHVCSIGGAGFFCTLRDKQDGTTKVASFSRPT